MNEQESFWAGDFGNKYTKRLTQKKLVKNNLHFFKKIFKKNKINSILEFGANNGSNLIALKKIYPNSKIFAVEINKAACKSLEDLRYVEVYRKSISDFNSNKKYDLTLVKGVLIHINPTELKKIYKKLSKYSKKFVLIAEYFNPFPTSINYRGHENKLFKRDFAYEFSKTCNNFKLIDYGFAYHKDKYPQDNLTWFLFKKTK